eukprot:366098-Chlamydomonas_euryale.AAC.3
MSSLIKVDVYEVVDRPPSLKLIPMKWVFKAKYDAFGMLEKYEVRLCAKGFRQVSGVDFDEIYAHVTKHVTMRTFLAFVAANDLELKQLDVTCAFLNGDLDKELFLAIPPGYEGVYPARPNIADFCLLVKCSEHGKAFINVYVDDMLNAGDVAAVEAVTAMLSKAFKFKLGDAHSFLGIAITRDRQARTITLNQTEYVKTLVVNHGLQLDSAGRQTPIDAKQVSKETQPLPLNNSYSELVGALLSLSYVTRPDITQAVNSLASLMREPHEHHWIGANTRMHFLGYSDSDHCGAIERGRRSTTDYVFLVNGTSVSWQSKLQQTVARSSTEAEYQAMAAAVSEALFLRKLYAEFSLFAHVSFDDDFKLPGMTIRVDNVEDVG